MRCFLRSALTCSERYFGLALGKEGYMIQDVRRLAEDAGREIMKFYRSGDWTVTSKTDESPLTQADLAANEIIVPGLKKLTNELIVSEESDPQSVVVGDTFWLIDPLDGTRDFVGKKDTFVVCISRVENFYPVFGVIHAPVTGETWWAEKGKGAFGPSGERLDLEKNQKRAQLIAAGSRSMPSERMQMFYDHFAIQEIRRYGSALKFCRLAEGDIDLYPRFGPTSEWDTAAGQVIVEEAGGKILDIISGERLRYGKPGFENRGGFIASRADLDLIGPLKAKGLLKN
jgi:3'(2'), 5'-bisphosphate nucleotidase